MAVIDFIKEQHGGRHLRKAREQQRQLSYFTKSKIQEDISIEYLQTWAEKKYITNDYFLNFIKMIFRDENFEAFYKYYRYPAASAELINDRIKPQLKRVFFAEDSYFKYILKGNEIHPTEIDATKFDEMIFEAILFKYNDILIHDLKDINQPFRELVCIDDVVAIECEGNEIIQIAYTAEIERIDENGNETEIYGFVYMDKFRYMFLDKDFKTLIDTPHDLGICPADFLVPHCFGEDVIRESIFTYVRPKLEEYVFLKTLQRMTDPNGAIPITVKLKTTENKKDVAKTTEIDVMPMSSGIIPKKTDSQLQAGTVISVPSKDINDADGKVNMDVIQNFFKFYHMPVENLNYLDQRIKDIEQSIIISLIGDYSEASETTKNELQVSKSYVNKQDKLRELSATLSRVRERSDYKLLALKYGPENVSVDIFYGSDFFLQTEEDLYAMFEKSPNTMERKSILTKLSSTRNKFNKDRAKRDLILYDLMPFISDKDFEFARQNIDPITFELQVRFNYWVSMFEAKYGDIVQFWESMETETDAEKLLLITNLLQSNIKDYVKSSIA